VVSDTNRYDSSLGDRERWEADIRLRERELAVKEREQETNSREVDAKIKELKRAKWNNPLVIAVLAAAVAAAGNAAVALINGVEQRAQDERRAITESDLEEGKAETARILEVLKTNDPDKAAVNLEFLLKAGLISNDERRKNLLAYLAKRTPGQGAALPTSTSALPTSTSTPSSLIADLDSEDVATRRNARIALAALGQRAIPIIATLLAENRTVPDYDYRQVLGVIVALSAMPQEIRCQAYLTTQGLREDVSKYAVKSEDAINKAAAAALSCH
jgi:hypothetical protein